MLVLKLKRTGLPSNLGEMHPGNANSIPLFLLIFFGKDEFCPISTQG